jgi:hypothetical protein
VDRDAFVLLYFGTLAEKKDPVAVLKAFVEAGSPRHRDRHPGTTPAGALRDARHAVHPALSDARATCVACSPAATAVPRRV